MADLYCPNCGTKQTDLPKFCYECGADLSAVVAKRMVAAQPAAGPVAAGPVAAAATLAPPPPAHAAQPAGAAPGGVASNRPGGITLLAVLEVIGGVLGLYSAKVLWDDAEAVKILSTYGLHRGDNYALFALLSLGGAVAAFALAWGLWQLRPWAWLAGVWLCMAGAAVYLLIAASYRDAVGSSVVNICIDGVVLYYLNLNSTRAIFGRQPTTFLQPQPAGSNAAGVAASGGAASSHAEAAPDPSAQPTPTPTPWGPVVMAPPPPPPPWGQPPQAPAPPPPWAQPVQPAPPPPWGQSATPAHPAQPPSPPDAPEPPQDPGLSGERRLLP